MYDSQEDVSVLKLDPKEESEFLTRAESWIPVQTLLHILETRGWKIKGQRTRVARKLWNHTLGEQGVRTDLVYDLWREGNLSPLNVQVFFSGARKELLAILRGRAFEISDAAGKRTELWPIHELFTYDGFELIENHWDGCLLDVRPYDARMKEQLL